MLAQDGEAAVVAMLSAARHMLDAMRAREPDAQVQALHKEYEQQWSRVRAAAEATESSQPSQSEPDGADITGLIRERDELYSSLVTRNRDLKEQIDLLRNLLASMQLADL